MADRKRSERRRLDWMVSVRFSSEDGRELERRARRLGMSMSAYLRHCAFRDIPPLTIQGEPSITTNASGPVVVHWLGEKSA